MDIKKILSIIGIVILVYLITSLGLKKIIGVFSEINPFFSFVSLFAIVPILLFTNVQWQILLKKQKINVSFGYSFKNILIGYFYGFITPGGFGAYIRALYLKHESKEPLPKCLSNIITFNTIDYITLLLLGSIGGLLVSSKFPYLFLAIIITSIIVIALFLFFLNKEKSKMMFTKLIQSRIFRIIKLKLNDPINSFYQDLPSFRDILLPFSISIIGWIVRFSELYIITMLFSIDIPYHYFIFILAVANVVASLPISIYGLGTREATFIALFSIFNILPEKTLSLSLFWFAIVWLFPSILGAIIVVKEGKSADYLTTQTTT